MKLKLWGVWLAAGLLAGCSGSAPEKEAQVSEAGQTRLQLGPEYLQQGDMDAARQNSKRRWTRPRRITARSWAWRSMSSGSVKMPQPNSVIDKRSNLRRAMAPY